MPDLVSDDLHIGLASHGLAKHGFEGEPVVCAISGNNEVNVAGGKVELEESRLLDVLARLVLSNRVEPRAERADPLRVAEEDGYIGR